MVWGRTDISGLTDLQFVLQGQSVDQEKTVHRYWKNFFSKEWRILQEMAPFFRRMWSLTCRSFFLCGLELGLTELSGLRDWSKKRFQTSRGMVCGLLIALDSNQSKIFGPFLGVKIKEQSRPTWNIQRLERILNKAWKKISRVTLEIQFFSAPSRVKSVLDAKGYILAK